MAESHSAESGPPSMFDTLRSLPLFRGASAEDISLLVEKIPLEFDSCARGEEVVASGCRCDRLIILLSGNVSQKTRVASGRIVLSQLHGAGFCVAPDSLFGLYNDSSSAIVAETDVSLLRISKGNLLELLEMSRIYLVNYLNMLSFRAQMRRMVAQTPRVPRVYSYIRQLMRALGERRAIETRVLFSAKDMARELGIDDARVIRQLRALASHENVRIDGTPARLALILK